MSIRITAQQRRSTRGKPCVFEPSALTVRPWHPGRAGEQPGVLVVRGRVQHRLTIEESYELINAIADTVEQFEQAEAEMEAQWQQRPYFTSTSEEIT